MRIGKVIGRITLSRSYETLAGGRFLLVEVQDRFSLAAQPRQSRESLIAYDNLGATDGDLIAFTESREASMPFYPEKRVPLDAYNAAILDHAVIELELKEFLRSNVMAQPNINRVSEWKIKEQLCDIGRRIWQKGFCAGNEGNHSYRIAENRFLCTPTGISKNGLKPDDICTVDGTGKQLAGKRKRSSEFLMHAAIYKARPDVVAVIHSHPPHATAFAIAGVTLPTCIHPEAEVFLGPVGMAKYVTPGDQRLADSILPFVKESNTVLMGNHGVVCFDTDLEQCYYKLEIVDAYARILLLAKQLGTVNTLGAEDMKQLIGLKAKFGLTDPRTKDLDKGVSCQVSDFMSRVGGEFGSRGRMATAAGTSAVTPQQSASPIEQAIAHLAPEKFGEAELEQLVQTITDQIMAIA